MRPSQLPLRMILVALAGLLVAAALGAAASNLTSRPVGISAEAVSVGEELVAKDARRAHERQRRRRARLEKRGRQEDPAAAGAPAQDLSEPTPSAVPIAPDDGAEHGDSGSQSPPPSDAGDARQDSRPEPADPDDDGGLEPPEDEREDRDDD